MRSLDRIDNFTNELNKIWKKYFPDLRFGQLMSNFFGWVFYVKQRDIFFPEEAEMLQLLNEYVKTGNSPFYREEE